MPDPIEIQFKFLSYTARLPFYATPGSAGMDMYSDEAKVIEPHSRALVRCGFAMALPEGYEAQIRPRSGLALKHGITIFNSPGTIDSDYRGEVHAMLYNATDDVFVLQHGERIAQMVIAPIMRVKRFEVVRELPTTQRGAGGFGSTGSQ